MITLEALTTIARLMRDLPGQKSLLWLSAGFPLALSAADGRFIRDADRQVRTPTANGSKVAMTPPDEMFHENVKTMAQEMSASNLAIYPIDARGLLPNPGVLVNINTMKEIAEETGGKAYYNDNDLAALVRAAIKDSREGYVLTFIPRDFEADGSFHRIQLQTNRHGIKLRYRPGYYAKAKHR